LSGSILRRFARRRASKQEGALRQRLLAWAQARGPGSDGRCCRQPDHPQAGESGARRAPGVVLQAHLDMVCQKNADSTHDFSRDPIVPVTREGWLQAVGTTLGADNGIGVALILAALEDQALVHGPLEALLTVDEEAGMGGARGLQPGMLQGD
jgi:dipeptidase D